MKPKCVVWDWNGTLLDDVEVSIAAMNSLLDEYCLPRISGADYYRGIFCFPVSEYYKRLGFVFDEDGFRVPAIKFIDNYNATQDRCRLRSDARDALERLKAAGVRQLVLSAKERESLTEQINAFGIGGYFSDILGIDNHLAAGKADMAAAWFSQSGIDSEAAVFIGDTVHDSEAAAAAGCRCILVEGGHQRRDILRSVCDNVAESLSAAAEMVISQWELGR